MGYKNALTPYDKKRIFTLKLKDEPLDLLRENLFNDLDLLIEQNIFRFPAGVNSKELSNIVCAYPVRIWYFDDAYKSINRDWLTPGDTYTCF